MWSTSLQSRGLKRNVIEFLEVQQELFFVLENPLKYNGFKHYLIDSYCCGLEQYWQWMKVRVVLSHKCVVLLNCSRKKCRCMRHHGFLLSVRSFQGSLLPRWQIPQWTELLQMETVLFKLHYLRYGEPSRRALLWHLHHLQISVVSRCISILLF